MLRSLNTVTSLGTRWTVIVIVATDVSIMTNYMGPVPTRNIPVFKACISLTPLLRTSRLH